MKSMKLFPKTFLYTLALMVLITLIGHALIYSLLPVIYINQKKSAIQESNHQMAALLTTMDSNKVEAAMENYSQKNQAFVKLLYNGKPYVYGTVFIQNNEDGSNSKYTFKASPFDSDKLGNATVPPGTAKSDDGIKSSALFPQSQFIKTDESFVNAEEKSCSLETTVTLQPVNEAKGVVLELLPFTLLLCTAISVLFALLYSRRITNPIKRISETTGKMKALDKLAKCEASGKDEISELALNVNFLYSSLLSTIASLQKEIDHVSEVEQFKVDFMRAASHELKTPVTAVNVMLENMIIGVGKFKDYETYLPKCKEQMERLSSMIHNILDASKLSASVHEEPMRKMSLSESVKQASEPYELIAKAKGLRFHVDTSQPFEATIPQKQFSKVLSNLLSNAVNYTAPGGQVRVYFQDKNLRIDNECKPLKPEQLERIFEPFYRLDFSRDRSTGGNGLGLYLTARILSAYQIRYSFAPYDHGMRFTISF